MITIKNQAAVTRPLNHNLFLNLNHFLVVADGRGSNKNPRPFCSRGFLLKFISIQQAPTASLTTTTTASLTACELIINITYSI
jgi:hypothetical protein